MNCGLHNRHNMVRFAAGVRDISLLQNVHTSCCVHTAFIQQLSGIFSTGVRGLGREDGHQPHLVQRLEMSRSILIFIDIFVNCDWVVTRWQQCSIHLRTNNTQNNTINSLGRVRAVPCLCELYPDICIKTAKKARKNLCQGRKNLNQVGISQNVITELTKSCGEYGTLSAHSK